MPKIACPGCGKQYNLPAGVEGKTASCKKCGKKFRIGKSQPSVAAKAKSAPTAKVAAKAKPKAVAPAVTSPPPSSIGDDFWDEALKEDSTITAASQSSMIAPSQSSFSSGSATSSSDSRPRPASDRPKPKKKKRKKKRAGWGADWGKVGGGLLTFFIFGGITVGLVIFTGYIYFWPAGIAIVGLFSALAGLMGSEGVW